MLRSLRESRGLYQHELAALTGVSQTKISKWETAREPVSEAVLLAITSRIGATSKEISELEYQLSLTRIDPLSYQSIDALGVALKQREIGAREASAELLEDYAPGFVPGLLQTHDYAWALLTELAVPSVGIQDAVRARIARQATLTRPGKSFRFMMSEAALYTCPGSVEIQISQLEMILSLSRRGNITVGVVPGRRGVVPAAMTGFCLFDRTFATAETSVSEQHISNPEQLAVLVAAYDKIMASALVGDLARRLIGNVIASFEQRLTDSK